VSGTGNRKGRAALVAPIDLVARVWAQAPVEDFLCLPRLDGCPELVRGTQSCERDRSWEAVSSGDEGKPKGSCAQPLACPRSVATTTVNHPMLHKLAPWPRPSRLSNRVRSQ